MNHYAVDPGRLIQMIKGGQNPQQLMLSILEGQAHSPLETNLLNLAKQGKTKEIEQIARNLSAERGIDFDKEFEAFRQKWGL